MTELTSERSREIEAELLENSRPASYICFIKNTNYQCVLHTLSANKMPLRRARVNFHHGGTFEFHGDSLAYLVPIYSIAPFGDPNDPVHPYGAELIDIGAVDAQRDKAATLYGSADFLGLHNYLYPPLDREVLIVKSPMRWIQQGGFGICPLTDTANRKLANDNRGLYLVANEDEASAIDKDLAQHRPKLAEVMVRAPR